MAAFFALSCLACTSVEPLGPIETAASSAARTYLVPREVLLATAYMETRFALTSSSLDAGIEDASTLASEEHTHRAPQIGIVGLRPWLHDAPVTTASRALGVSESRIANEPDSAFAALAILMNPTRSVLSLEVAMARVGDLMTDTDEERAAYIAELGFVIATGFELTISTGETIVVLGDAPTRARVGGKADGIPGATTREMLASNRNYSVGRTGLEVSKVVIHTTQGSYAGTIAWFRNAQASASAHYVIRSLDGEITQMVRETDMAWHAGNRDYNLTSVGIEHEGFVAEGNRWYTDKMYRSSARLTRAICDRYKFECDRSHVTGHNEVPHPSRPGVFGGAGAHHDPGSMWDWDLFMRYVADAGNLDGGMAEAGSRDVRVLDGGLRDARTGDVRMNDARTTDVRATDARADSARSDR